MISKILQGYPELVAYLDSRFSNDFGSEMGLGFQDGTCEQDVGLSELLTLFQNGNECSFNKSCSKITTTMGSETTPIYAGPNMGSFYNMGNDLEQSTSQTNVDGVGSSKMGQPVIKVRSRQSKAEPTDPNSEDVMGQGTAPRRLRLDFNSLNGDDGDETSATVSEVSLSKIQTAPLVKCLHE